MNIWLCFWNTHHSFQAKMVSPRKYLVSALSYALQQYCYVLFGHLTVSMHCRRDAETLQLIIYGHLFWEPERCWQYSKWGKSPLNWNPWECIKFEGWILSNQQKKSSNFSRYNENMIVIIRDEKKQNLLDGRSH